MSRSLLTRRLKRGPQVSPFLVLGDPTPELSVALARAAVDAGAGMLEIGFPYGDPVADGPAIQAADTRALEGGTSTTRALELLGEVHRACPKTPLNLLVYGNLVHQRGFERFCEEASAAGASSLLVPDVCLEESAPLKRACRRAKLGHVQLVGPLTSPERLTKIDRAADGFVYLVAHQGVTGVREAGFDAVAGLVSRVAGAMRNPLCLGFGLSKREQIARAFDAGARVAVVGSHLARVIERVWAETGPDRESRLVDAYRQAVGALVLDETPKPKPEPEPT